MPISVLYYSFENCFVLVNKCHVELQSYLCSGGSEMLKAFLPRCLGGTDN